MKREKVRVSEGLGNDMFKTPCDICGNSVYTWKVRDELTYKCKKCRELDRINENEKRDPLNRLEDERRLEIAIEYLETKRILEQYSNALDIVGKNLYKKGWFQSSNEILVALELIRKGIEARHQVKMGRWRVDFLLPELKVVLEVDGSLFHNKSTKEKEKLRDNLIISTLGPGWEVIRIKDEMIKKNIQKLVPAIKRVKKERNRIRSSYKKLPDWYNDNQI